MRSDCGIGTAIDLGGAACAMAFDGGWPDAMSEMTAAAVSIRRSGVRAERDNVVSQSMLIRQRDDVKRLPSHVRAEFTRTR